MKINRLKEVFQEAKIRNIDISIYLDKKKETVSRWVNNRQQPPITEMIKIAEYLRIDIRDCFHPSDWSRSKTKPYERIKKQTD